MTLQEKLARVINEHSLDNDSNTPDYILAEYLAGCLNAFNTATRSREIYYGREDPLIVKEIPLDTVSPIKQELIKETNAIQQEIKVEVDKLIEAK